MRIIRRTLTALLVLTLAIQFIPVKPTNPPERGALIVPPRVESIMQRACYDCHSNRTVWPWYSKVAPVSWWVINHVNDGRRHLNFSEWQPLPAEKRREQLGEILEEVEEGEMPLASYVLGHPEARLSQADLQALREWINTQGIETETED